MKEFIKSKEEILEEISNLPIMLDSHSNYNKEMIKQDYLGIRTYTIYYLTNKIVMVCGKEALSFNQYDKNIIETIKADFLSMKKRVETLAIQNNYPITRMGFIEN